MFGTNAFGEYALGESPSSQSSINVSPGTASLASIGFVPSLGQSQSVSPLVAAVSMAGFAPTVSSPIALATHVTFFVVADITGTAVPDVSGLDYAFYDQPRISAGQAPVKFGNNLAIIGGVANIDITGITSLRPGGIGRIVYGLSDGTTIGGGQVTVS